MRLNDLSQIDIAYAQITGNPANKDVNVSTTKQAEILLTDATQYLPEAKDGQVKAGSPMGGGPGTKDKVLPFAKKTGPEAADNFEKVGKLQDPGADKAVMKANAEHDESEEENSKTADNAKITTPKEKVRESVAQNNKYNYKPRFNTMSKPKFDQLFEDALNGIPFKDNDASTEEPTGVPPADDFAADDVEDLGTDEEDVDLSPEEVVECLEKVLKSLKKNLVGDEGSEDELELPDDGEVGDEEPVVAEDVEVEDLGTPLTGAKKGKPDQVKHQVVVGSLKATGKGAAQKGSLKNEPDPKELSDAGGKSLMGKSNKVGNLAAGKSLLET